MTTGVVIWRSGASKSCLRRIIRGETEDMMRFTWIFLTLILAGALAVFRPAYEPDSGMPEGTQTARATIDILASELGLTPRVLASVPGVSVAVRDADGSVTQWAAGPARALSTQPVTIDTRFEAASLSKPVVAYAILQLVEQGLLDLDTPYQRGGYEFTLRQVLSHQAGFDNSLSAPHQPVGPAGEFSYAGTGYLFLGEEIERVTGQSFQAYMNEVVLPDLGMQNSRFGITANDPHALALPHINAGLILGLASLVAGVLALALLGLHALVRLIFSLDGPAVWGPRVIALVSIAGGTALPVLLLGGANQAIFLVLLLVFFLLVFAGIALLMTGEGAARTTGGVLAMAAVALILLQPAIPLAERRPGFLPAAGLRTTPGDYLLFLEEMSAPQNLSAALVNEMLAPQARASQGQDWGLGLGIQRGEDRLVWHWGVNFPGYQALAIARPETGEAIIVLMNGGAMHFQPGGYRFAGLEMAREAATEILGGEHGAYWHEVQ